MKFACPKCQSKLEIQKTFNKKIHISCSNCNLEDLLEFSKNIDEVFLEFLSRFDEGSVTNEISKNLKEEGIIRDEKEIIQMIGNNNPDEITKSILFSKKDFIAQYKILKNPEPKMGCDVEDLGLDESITNYLKEIGIEKLYKFQEEAIREITFGENVVIEAPTASGKTEAFLIPIIQKIIKESSENNNIFAIFVYPTKSLARDQYPKILKITEKIGINVGVFDGDTEQVERRKILEKPPQIIITNFDVLHYHLWHQTKFASLLSTLKVLVVDEAHVYSGIFGSNVHYILKRLKRICNNKIQFVAASATLEDARNFCEQLFGVKMKIIHGSGKKGQTDFVMIFPSLRTQRALMVNLTKNMTEKNHKTMIFNNSHLNSETFGNSSKKTKSEH